MTLRVTHPYAELLSDREPIIASWYNPLMIYLLYETDRLKLMSLLARTFHLILGSFIALFGGAGFLWGIHRLRTSVFVRNYHPRHLGRVVVRGKACATNPNKVLRSILSKRSCIAYNFSILELKGKSNSRILYRESRGQWNLSIQTKMAKVQINPREMDFKNPHFQDSQNLFGDFANPLSLTLLAEKGINPRIFGIRRSLLLEESVISDGDEIWALGWIHDQALQLEDAIVTDKSVSRIIVESSLACIVSAWFVWIALAVLAYTLR